MEEDVILESDLFKPFFDDHGIICRNQFHGHVWSRSEVPVGGISKEVETWACVQQMLTTLQLKDQNM